MTRKALRLLLLIILPDCILAGPVEKPPVAQFESEVHYVRYVGPLLREKYFARHGGVPEKIEGSLDVRSLEALPDPRNRHGSH